MLFREPALVQVPTPTIANEINAATRVLHAELNKLIIARLPLALPPQQTTSIPYTIGLQAFSQIFFAFEAAWDQCLTRQHQSVATNHELLSALNCLLPPNLRRTQHLRNDLRHLHSHIATPNVVGDTQSHNLSTISAATNKPGSTSRSYISHINEVVLGKPHVIVAYTWVMYMALFSGGRWIRAQLRTAGDEFWVRGGFEDTIDIGYSFLTFEGLHDGNDIKSEFKRQLANVDSILTPAQRLDIVTEAQEVFRRTVELIGQLDGMAGNFAATTIEKKEGSGFPVPDVLGLAVLPPEKIDVSPGMSLRAGKPAYRRMPMILLPALLCILFLFITTSIGPSSSHLHQETT